MLAADCGSAPCARLRGTAAVVEASRGKEWTQERNCNVLNRWREAPMAPVEKPEWNAWRDAWRGLPPQDAGFSEGRFK